MKFIIDMDGVLYRGDKKIKGAEKFIEFLQKKDIPFLLATNNSTKTRKMFSEKLSKMGIYVNEDHIITSSYVTAETLKNIKGSAIVIGGAGIYDELKRISWEIVDMENWKSATHVIVGMDIDLTYNKLKYGCLAINNGAEFVATNDDKNFPAEEGLIPGAGSIVAALKTATGKSARIMGKPNQPYIEILKSILGEEDLWVVGDRMETDMLMADKIGAKKVLVLSGVANSGKADFVVNSVAELPDILRNLIS